MARSSVLVLWLSSGCAALHSGAPAPSLAGNVVLVTPERRLVAYDPSTDRRTPLLPQLAGEVIDAATGPLGLVVLSCVADEGGDRCRVARYDPADDGLHPAAVLAEARNLEDILVVERSGARAVIEQKVGEGRVAVVLAAGEPEPRVLASFHYVWRAAFDPAGEAVVVGGTDPGCEAKDLKACRIVLKRVPLGKAEPEEIEPGLCLAYQPVFVPGAADTLIYQASAGVGPDCPPDTNTLPLDIVRRSPEGLTVLRHRAVGPALSPDGRRIAWLHYPDGCTKLPCAPYEVEVADLASPEAYRTVTQGAFVSSRCFSLDGRWLAVRQLYPGMKGWSAARVVLARLDGPRPAQKVAGLGAVAGWL